jgi:carboxylesterase type B
VDPSIRVWRGIPYAAPPVGRLRWAPPQPAEPWQTTLNATKFGFACPQQQVTMFDYGAISEGTFIHVF